MSRVEFHSGVSDTLNFACRLLRKAWRQGASVVVTAPPQTLDALDRELWTFEAQEFVPHWRVRPGQGAVAALRRTPIWLCEADAPASGPKVLVNLGAEIPRDLDHYERIIEIVSTDAGDRQLARTRWRDYEARGLSINHHAKAAT
jgi:DNA polymerase-3 subunit chi